MFQNIPVSTSNDFLNFNQDRKKKVKMVNVFICKTHGRIDVKHDKLINVAGTKFCPFCMKDFLERGGICQLKKSKEPSRRKRNK